jgi:hypothetical protein
MPANNCVMTAGVRLHGRARSRATAMAASPTAVPSASRASTIPAAASEDFPLAVSTAAKTAAMHRPTASAT